MRRKKKDGGFEYEKTKRTKLPDETYEEVKTGEIVTN